MNKKNIKNAKTEVAIENLKGFATKGAKIHRSNIPTGHPALDLAIHFGVSLDDDLDLSTLSGYDPNVPLGIPLGILVEIFGDEGGGKSSLCYKIVGSAQKMGIKCLWVDAEHSFSENLAIINGVDLDELFLADKASTMEEILDGVKLAIKSGFKLIIVDSVAALVPSARAEAAGADEQMGMALKARILSENLPDITNEAGSAGATVIFINQIRENPGIMFGDKNTTPGGKALKFLSSLRIGISKRIGAKDAMFIEDPENPKKKKYIGQKSGCKLAKNRFAKPLVDSTGKRIVFEIPIYFEPFFTNIEESAVDVARQLGIISCRKNVFKYGELKFNSKGELVKHIIDNNLTGQLVSEVKEKASSSEEKIVLPCEITTYNPNAKRVKVIESDSKDIDNSKDLDTSSIVEDVLEDDDSLQEEEI